MQLRQGSDLMALGANQLDAVLYLPRGGSVRSGATGSTITDQNW